MYKNKGTEFYYTYSFLDQVRNATDAGIMCFILFEGDDERGGICRGHKQRKIRTILPFSPLFKNAPYEKEEEEENS